MSFQGPLSKSRSGDRVRIKLAQLRLEEGHGERGRDGSQTSSNGSSVSRDLSPQELLCFGQSQISSDDVEAFDDLVAGHLDLVDEQVGAVLVHGEVVEGRDENRNQNLENVFQRSASFQVSAAKVRELFLELVEKYKFNAFSNFLN